MKKRFFKRFTNGCVNVMNRYLPDPFLFAVILSIVVYIAAIIATGLGPLEILNAWGNANDGFWGLLSFSMQMALVLVLGSAMASAPVCRRALSTIAGVAHNKRSAILVTTFVSVICCWLNWGFGLVAGALLAKEVARHVRDVDYRLLIASAYSGFVVWHAGLSGSIPLSLVEGKDFQGVVYRAGLEESIFHPANIIICIAILIILPLINYSMHPAEGEAVLINPALLESKGEKKYEVNTPAEKIEHSKILWAITGIAGAAYVVYYFVKQAQEGVSIGNSLNLNIVNFIFLFLGIILHGDLRRYMDAVVRAVSGAAGILIQFPFYAGIMGMMTVSNAAGTSLAGVISNFFVSISNGVTYPLFTFYSAGIVNFFVPSGGGQWAVQGPIVMQAADQLSVNYGISATTLAWGDAWTNMIQPFWALPALGIAGLSAKDIMGYLVIVLIVTGVIISLGLIGWALLL